MSMNTAAGSMTGMTLDLHSLDALKAQATKDPRAAINGAAKQLETLFMQELMKNMRASTLSSGMLENSGTKMGTEMLDTEFASRMSGLPHGLSAAIERQLSRQVHGTSANGASNGTATKDMMATGLQHLALSTLSMGTLQGGSHTAASSSDGGTSGNTISNTNSDTGVLHHFDLLRTLSNMLGFGDAPASGTTLSGSASPGLSNGLSTSARFGAHLQPEAAAIPAAAANAASGQISRTSVTHLRPAEAFVRKHEAEAKAIEAETGIPAANLIGQAAHETGWGRHEIKNKDGSPSHNLFGIKAGAGWTGKVAEVTTTEYIGGVAHRVIAKFRSYDSYEDAFRDHARLLTSNPRYSSVVAHATSVQGYAQGLQKAGYATDPAYAEKLTRVINTTLRLQRTIT